MGAKNYFIQLYGFVVKVFLQRWRYPVVSIIEVLLPMFFCLLLSICYWTTDRGYKPAQVYDGGTTGYMMNMSQMATYFFCTPSTAPTVNGFSACNESLPYSCLKKIGDGKQVCYMASSAGGITGMLYGYLYFASGKHVIFTLDTYLIWSAYLTEQANTQNPTFLGRSSRASLSHYGALLISSDNTTLAEEFMTYLESWSVLSKQVLHPTVFSDYGSAESYAVSHPANVWAIIDLPNSVAYTSEEKTEFTISMNYTATPETYKSSKRSLFSRVSTDGADDYILYWASGFLTLQTYVNSWLVSREASNTSKVTGPASYVAKSPAVMGVQTFLTNYGVSTMPMPTPPSYSNEFLEKWQYYIPLVAMMAALFPVARMTALIVEEKPTGIRESMLIMGMHQSCMFGGWYFSSLLMDLASALLVAMILKVGFLSYVSFGVLVTLYFTFLQQNTALAIFISTLFSNPRLASWCAAFLIFIFAIPAYNFPSGMSSIAKIFLTLLPCIGFTLSFFDLTEYASYGAHFTWTIARKGSYNVAIAIGMMWASWGLFMLFAFYLDRVFPAAVGRREPWYFFLRPLIRCCIGKRPPKLVPMTQRHRLQFAYEYVSPPAIEARRKERAGDNDPFSPASPQKPYFTATTGGEPLQEDVAVQSQLPKESNIEARVGTKDSGERARTSTGSSYGSDTQDHSSSHALIEHREEVVDPCAGNVAAVFDNLYKVYYSGGLVGFFYTFFTGLFRRGDRTVALDGVTFAMKKGEVSVLLGPNGAGKSTIMGVATGMVKPTSGEVYIDGHRASDDLAKCRQHIGYCPQVDIVWPKLTVEEHLSFYARLKGCNSFFVGKHVTEAISLVDLEDKRHCIAANLSGGQRRRLCVAIALVADSTVLLLDEPTAGMDIVGRKTVYDALNRARANRSVLLCTHLLDEADRIGDRILLVNDGRLCAEGSAPYLKSQMKVGYIVTCVLTTGMSALHENRAVADLIEFVKRSGYADHAAEKADEVVAIPPGCSLLGVERRGREVSFRFPMSLLSGSGQGLLESLQDNREKLSLRGVSLNMTSLEEVFMTALHMDPAMPGRTMGALEVEAVSGREALDGDFTEAVEPSGKVFANDRAAYRKNGGFSIFLRHFRAMFIKRCNFARRDLMLLIFQVIIPILFLVLSLLINLVRPPTQRSLLIDMSMFPGYETNPGDVLVSTWPMAMMNSFQVNGSTPTYSIGAGNALDFHTSPARIQVGTSSESIYNGTFYLSELMANESFLHTSPRYYGLSPSNMVLQSGKPSLGSVVMHNISYGHALAMGLGSLFDLARYQIFANNTARVSVRNRPMPFGEYEKEMFDANKQVMCGIFVILPFILIPCNTISYIVREKETGARHMQWLSGASVAAYWLSSFVFDFACYIGTEFLAIIIFVIFNRTEYVKDGNIGPTIVLFLFFGFSSVVSAYLLSFFFHSSFTAQTVVLLVNFVFGFLWVTLEEMLAMGAYKFTYYFTAIVRILPAVSFGEGLYVLSGQRIATMMFPTRVKSSMFSLLTLTSDPSFKGGIGTGLLYMGCVTVGCVIFLIVLEYLRVQRIFRSVNASCYKEDDDAEDAANDAVRDKSVEEEENRVCASPNGPATDMIAVQHLRKHYFGSREPALADLSLGVREGEVMGLLGLNGAGKSTAISIIAGEIMPTRGEAFVNHLSVLSAASRSYVGYCPQGNPLLDLLSPKEHLWLYARLRGMRESMIRDEVNMLIRELGLFPHRHQAAHNLSGGNKRRLTLAVALVGRTTSVLLDEPTAGMDALARAQTCAVVKRLTGEKSVILTTHLLDEVEAMADRVSFLSRGRLRCVGTPYELRVRNNRDSAYTVTITFSHEVNLTDEHKETVSALVAFVRESIDGGAREDGNADVEKREEARWCELTEVHVASVRLLVQSPLGLLCGAMTKLRNGTWAEDMPAVDFVGISQPTLEDILLQED